MDGMSGRAFRPNLTMIPIDSGIPKQARAYNPSRPTKPSRYFPHPPPRAYQLQIFTR